jgi:hypothetical protein
MDQRNQVAPFFNLLRPLKPYPNSNYIAFVIIALNHHAQLNRNICYILVYTSTCAFPILLGYSLWLYYLTLHYLLTRGCDHLIGRCRDILIHTHPPYWYVHTGHRSGGYRHLSKAEVYIGTFSNKLSGRVLASTSLSKMWLSKTGTSGLLLEHTSSIYLFHH